MSIACYLRMAEAACCVVPYPDRPLPTSGCLHIFEFSDHSRGRRLTVNSIPLTTLPIPATTSSKGQSMTQKSVATPARGAMTTSAAARIQSAAARSHGGKTPAGSFASRGQAAAARNAARGKK